MKKIFLSIFSVCMFAAFISCNKPVEPVNVMTFNIRMDTPLDSMNQWGYRKDLAADVIKFYDVDIFGAQEVLHHQLTDMLDRLPGYTYVGVGREDGATKGEYSPVIYKKDRFDLEDSGTFWLAEDKNAVGKKGWDAACERVASWGIFNDKKTGKKFFFLNTHLDHIGKVARKEGATLVLDEANMIANGLPIIVTGDFNATPDDVPIQVLTNTSDSRHLVHARDLAKVKYGPEWTFHSYGRVPMENRKWIDYIFVKGDFEVINNGVLAEYVNHLYPSDHCPIVSTLIIK